MIRFMLLEKHSIDNEDYHDVLMLGSKNKVLCTFIGNDEDDRHLNRDIAPLVAGDYVEMMNDKYKDKELNEEWPEVNPALYLKYYAKRFFDFLSDRKERAIKKRILNKIRREEQVYAMPTSDEIIDMVLEELEKLGDE